MSSVLSASPSLVDMDHSSDPDTPSKPFIRDSSSSSSPSSSSSSLTTNQQGSPKQPALNSPPRPAKSEPVIPTSQSHTIVSVNGHTPEEQRQVPSHSSLHATPSPAARQHDENHSHIKDETDRDDTGHLPGSDPDDDPDLGSGESDGDWSQDDIEADIRRVKVRQLLSLRVSPNNDHVHPQVYELIGQKWTDRGTAFCQGDYDEEARQARLIARAEHSNEILLQCIIRTSDVYQRQQGINYFTCL
jgi:protein phosphatase 4 regulatory subunit 3